MNLQTGVDIVDLKKFSKQMGLSPNILMSYLTKQEILEAKMSESRAGIFATKEALIKAGVIKPGKWLDVEIRKDENGKPYVYKKNTRNVFEKIPSLDISIAHDGDYVVAFVVWLNGPVSKTIK